MDANIPCGAIIPPPAAANSECAPKAGRTRRRKRRKEKDSADDKRCVQAAVATALEIIASRSVMSHLRQAQERVEHWSTRYIEEKIGSKQKEFYKKCLESAELHCQGAQELVDLISDRKERVANKIQP
jgi:hypothetical protein